MIKLQPASASDIALLQQIFERAPAYSHAVSGRPPSASEGREMFEALPPGVDASRKNVLLIFSHGVLVGCADVIRGYPSADTAWVGLLLLDESHQRCGLGAAAYFALEALISSWTEIASLQMSVVMTNSAVIPFWKRVGFTATGVVKPYLNSQVAVFAKSVPAFVQPSLSSGRMKLEAITHHHSRDLYHLLSDSRLHTYQPESATSSHTIFKAVAMRSKPLRGCSNTSTMICT